MKLLAALASLVVVSGDACYSQGASSVLLREEAGKLRVMVRALSPWVGFGIPKDNSFDEMAGGDFVLGGGGSVFDRHQTANRNGHPDTPATNGFVNSTQSVNTINGVTLLSFARDFAPAGRHPIDSSKPFRFLWAVGNVNGPASNFGSFLYHGASRGSVLADLSTTGNCDAATRAFFPAAKTNGPPKAGKKGKKGTVCAAGKALCTPALQAKGANCVVGKCFTKAAPTPAPVTCTPGQSLCTAASQAQGVNCIVGICFTPKPAAVACATGQLVCTAADQAQGANCIIGMCFTRPLVAPACTMGQSVCTTADQAQGANCIIGRCFTRPMATTVCATGQSVCTAADQAQGANCIVGTCFSRPLKVCANGQLVCTAADQSMGANCIIGNCFTPNCPMGQTRCTAQYQAQGANCIVGLCFSMGR